MITIAPELKALPFYQLGDLLELQGDLKDLTERNAARLRRSIAKHGIFVPFFVWPAPDGNKYILDGHQRKRTLVKDGHGALPVPCVLVHADTLQEAKEKLLVISSQYGHITQEGFDTFTFDLPDVGEMVNFDALNFEFGQDEDEEPEQGDAEPQIDRAAELQELWGTERGQLWAIGEHRLLCGDSTVRADVERVMGGERAELAPVDPPYNVGFDYDGETVDDTKTAEKYEAFSRAWFEECRRVSDKQIVTPGCNNLALWLRWFDAYHWAPWTKTNSMTNGKVSRFWCWEPVLFFGEKWVRRRPNDVFDYPISNQQGVANHPCPKPLKMWTDLIEHYSEPGAVIYESFGGSGTTMVACQNLGRKCRMVEISPSYVAVVLQRMADAFPHLDIYKVESLS